MILETIIEAVQECLPLLAFLLLFIVLGICIKWWDYKVKKLKKCDTNRDKTHMEMV